MCVPEHRRHIASDHRWHDIAQPGVWQSTLHDCQTGITCRAFIRGLHRSSLNMHGFQGSDQSAAAPEAKAPQQKGSLEGQAAKGFLTKKDRETSDMLHSYVEHSDSPLRCSLITFGCMSHGVCQPSMITKSQLLDSSRDFLHLLDWFLLALACAGLLFPLCSISCQNLLTRFTGIDLLVYPSEVRHHILEPGP